LIIVAFPAIVNIEDLETYFLIPIYI